MTEQLIFKDERTENLLFKGFFGFMLCVLETAFIP